MAEAQGAAAPFQLAGEEAARDAPLQQAGDEAARDAYVMHRASPLFKSLLRSPALLTTFLIELVVAFVFSKYTDTFNQYPLLISFQPVISAISGNVGLQASSTNVRAMSLGLIREDAVLGGMKREIFAGLISGVAMAVICGVTAGVWYSPLVQKEEGHTWHGSCIFALAIASGMFVSIMSAAVTGSAAPLLSKRFLGYDPSAAAGPLETAFQDVVGGTILLALSAWILETWGDFAAECVGDSIDNCLSKCQINGGNSTIAPYSTACIRSCLSYLDQGVC